MTQPVKVDPAALLGYAKQLERNADEFEVLKRYCDFYCDDAGGLTGLLWVTAVPAINLLAEVQYLLLPSARKSLYTLAAKLQATASSYQHTDNNAADRIGATMPDWPGWQGQPGAVDIGQSGGTGQSGDFSDPASVEPPPPAPNRDMQKEIDDTLGAVADIDRWLAKVIRFSLRKELFPWLTGDWGKVREVAQAYGALGGDKGVMAINTNLRSGMASLAPSWDGPAAAEFELYIYERWGQALAAEADICKVSKEGLEALAAQAEQLYRGLDNLLTALLTWLAGRVLKAVSFLLRLRFIEAGKIIDEIWSNLKLILDLIEQWARIWPDTVKAVIELAEAQYAFAKLTLKMIDGDLAAIQAG